MRETTAISINRLLHRLPLILDVLEEIDEPHGTPKAGDDEIRTGAINAIRSIITRLKNLGPASPHQPSAPVSEPEKIASEWLRGDLPARLIPESLLDQLSMTISGLLPFSSATEISQPEEP